MKKTPRSLSRTLAYCIGGLLVLNAGVGWTAEKTWTGAGDARWLNPANWLNGAPVDGDSLVFTGTQGLQNTNNISPGTTFTGITFAPPAGLFTLWGNSIVLGGDIADNQIVTLQTINLPMVLNATRGIGVVTGGELTLGGNISGPGFGLTKTGAGLLNLRGNNSFGGPLTINGGTVRVSSDSNLGLAPGTPVAGNVVLNGGTLAATASFTLNPNRGIAVGPTSGSGAGVLYATNGTTTSYGGVIANNGGMGGLGKDGFGGLTLFGANTFTGPTIVSNGTLTLDFSQPTAPINNILSSGSDVLLGGGNAGNGAVNYAALIMNGKAGANNVQTLGETHVTFVGARVIATNGVGGSATLNLGELTHDPGGTVVFLPPSLFGGSGEIKTSTENVNGILGGWATVGSGAVANNLLLSTNFAAVDASGNIVAFTNFTDLAGGQKIHDIAFGTNNVRIPQGYTGDVIVNDDGAGTVTDINTLFNARTDTGFFSIIIGTNNTLRLGKYGTLFRASTGNTITWAIGRGTTGGGNGSQSPNGAEGEAVITAGGPTDNTPGELIFHLNSSSQSGGSFNVEANIKDNGTGAVTVVKMGRSSMKIRGHNSYSGGTYVLQGRFQLAGTEIGTVNADAFGSGPVFALPGTYFLAGGLGTWPGSPGATNIFFVAGVGTDQEPLGIFRGGTFSGEVHLIGDTTFGGDCHLVAPITGPFAATFGSPATISGGAIIYNTNNAWTGDTTFTIRLTGATQPNNITLSNSHVIPNGFGFGNVLMRSTAASAQNVQWNMEGFDEVINGLSSEGPGNRIIVQNRRVGSASTLIVGDNNQSGTFGGTIRDNAGTGGTVALMKIGAGVQTLTGTNTYTGNTIVSNGTLAVSGNGSLSNSPISVLTGATLDVQDVVGGFHTPGAVSVSGGTLIGSSSATTTMGSLNMADGGLTLAVDTTAPNITVGTLTTTGGSSNVVNIRAVRNVASYPAQFTIVQYTSIVGTNNFVIGATPSANTMGYITNINSSIVLVLTDGPKALTWKGNDPVNPTIWSSTVTNWLGFGIAPAAFNSADIPLFNDTANTFTVNIAENVLPSDITISNQTQNYTFVGAGSIGGIGGLTKEGAGTATFLNTGGDGYKGGVAVSGGKLIFGSDNAILGGFNVSNGAVLQAGTNGTSGTLPAGGGVNDGSILFASSGASSYAGAISGLGTITNLGTGSVTLSGANTFTGAVGIATGTLLAGSGSALGAVDNGTFVSSGATLDVNGNNIGAEPVTASGAGVGGAGAIVNNNTSASITRAIRHLTLTGDTVLGGASRWDLRSSADDIADATLNGAFNITKVGSNQISVVGATVDPSFGNVNVNQGTFSIERFMLAFGNESATISVASGATLQFFSDGAQAVNINKNITLNGDGLVNTLSIASPGGGGASTLNGSISVSGNVIVNNSAAAVGVIQSSVSGNANVRFQGGGTNNFNSGVSYTGTTVISNSAIYFNGGKTGGTGLTGYNATVGGLGADENITLNGGSLVPGAAGDPTIRTFTAGGNLSLDGTTVVFDLESGGSGDQVSVFGTLTLNGTNTLRLQTVNFLTEGQTYTLFTLSGTLPSSVTNNLQIVPPTGYTVSIVDPATTPNSIRVHIDHAVKNLTWIGCTTTWDVAGAMNWDPSGGTSCSAVFTNLDIVNFTGIVPNRTNAMLVGALEPSQANFVMEDGNMFLTGSGSLTGTASLRVRAMNDPVFQDIPLITYIANTGSNDFTGPVHIDQSELHVVSGGLGSGAIVMTNSAAFPASALVLKPAGTLHINNAISGSAGSIKHDSTGVTYLNGVSSYGGPITVAQGTLAAGAGASGDSTALGNTNGTTVVSSGATLDVNGQNLGSERVLVSGAGVGNNGAIVNNSTNAQTQALRYVTLQGDTTFGGTARLDIRGPAAALLTEGGQAFNITKVGPNQVALVAITNLSPELGNIDIQEGIFAVQTTTTNVGNPAGVVTVHSGAALSFFNLSTPFDKVITAQSGSVITNESGTSTIVGPITVSGDVTISAAGTALVLSNTVNTSGAITRFTKAGGGRLEFQGNAFPMPISLLEVLGGTLDLSASTTPNLTLAVGLTLRGNGTITGNLTANGGSVVSPGPNGTNAIGTLTLDNATFTTGGQIHMELNAEAESSDRIVATNVNYSSVTINVTNISATALSAGQSFLLFDATNYSGAPTVNLPDLAPGLSWSNSVATNGRVTVVGPPGGDVQVPRITSVVRSGSNLIMSGTNGTASGTYYVISSTNIASPLSTWIRKSTNMFGADGTFSVTNAIDSTKPREFFNLLQQVP